MLGLHSLGMAMSVLHFLYLAGSYPWNVGNVWFTFLLCVIALCIMYVCMYVYIYIYIYACACVGDCALCMIDSHGHVSDPLWPWVLLTLWHEYKLKAIVIGAYSCHIMCIVTMVWSSWSMSLSDIGFLVYVPRINMFKCFEGLWLILAEAR